VEGIANRDKSLADLIVGSRKVIEKVSHKDLTTLREHSTSARKEMARRRNHKGYVRAGENRIIGGDLFIYLKTGTEYLEAKRNISKSKELWKGPFTAVAVNDGRIGFRPDKGRKLRWKPIGLCEKVYALRDGNGQLQ